MTQMKDGSDLPSRQQDKAQKAQSKLNQGKARTKNRRPRRNSDVDGKHKNIVTALVKNEKLVLGNYEDVLLGTDEYGWNLLHRIILRLKRDDLDEYKHASNQVLALVERLVIDEPGLFIQNNGSGNIPLLDAASSKLEILFQVINLVIPDAILASLDTPCSRQDQKCPLGSVNKLLLDKYRHEETGAGLETANEEEQDDQDGHEEVEVPKSDNVAEEGRDSPNVCLHGKIDIQKLKEKNESIRKALSEGLAFETKTHFSCLKALINATNFDRRIYPNQRVPVIPLEGFRFLLQLCPNSVFDSPAEGGFSPLQMAIRLYTDPTVDYGHLFLVIKELVERSPTSIYFEARNEANGDVGKTAYRLLKELDETTAGYAEADCHDNDDNDGNEDEGGREESDCVQTADSCSDDGEQRTSEFETAERKISREMTEELLKMACIGAVETECALEDKLKFLYWGDVELVRKISLNLHGESKKLDNSYVTKVIKRSGMVFETILASVKLPYWTPQTQHAEKTKTPAERARPPGGGTTQASDPYTGIFKWLWESKVRKIFSVEVDDTGPEPHSNAAIRESLRQPMPDGTYRDFKVETFKWKKYDICSEAVYSAVPNAKEVHLYSLGNTAVLRSWACSSGLHKMENLERLVIEIFPSVGRQFNTNDEYDCRAYEDELKLKLAQNCPRLKYDRIKVDFPKSSSGQGDCGGNAATAGGEGNNKSPPVDDTPSPDYWIKKMQPFKQFAINMLKDLPDERKPVVKVAVLDDGVSLDNLSLNGGKGQSFRMDNVEYWVGPCSHGTRMASCIRQLCPMAQLYVGRLDDSGVAEKQKFTTESCFQALKWARKMGADIVSMSWSSKKRDHGMDEGEINFINELNEVIREDKVILFASLPDKGATSEITKYIPVGNEKVIRIGSATMFGEEAKEIIFANRDFLLPGEEIKTASGESDKGSSYATAYAAGLAALVLYCLRAHKALEDYYIRQDHPLKMGYEDTNVAKRLAEAATIGGMRKIFKVLSNQSAKDEIPKKGFFVRPYLALDSNFGVDERNKIEYLRNLSYKILPLD